MDFLTQTFNLRDILLAVFVNLALLAVLYGTWRYWQRRRPLTPTKLRRILSTRTPQSAVPHTPCGGNLAACAVLAQVCQLCEDNSTDLLSLLFTHWGQQGCLTVTATPKRQLHGYGEGAQDTLFFPTHNRPRTGAEAQLYHRFADHPEAADGLQQSQLYWIARDQSAALHNDLQQLYSEGRAQLRSLGMLTHAEKRAWFGFAAAPLIFTPKGVREACALHDLLSQPQPPSDATQSLLWRLGNRLATPFDGVLRSINDGRRTPPTTP